MEAIREPLVILTSGGLDSFVARYFARSRGFESIRSLWINIGQPYAAKEMQAISHFPFPVEIIDCPTIAPQYGNVPTIDQQVIPGRNLLFAVIAASIGAERIWLGALRGEMHTDVGSRDKSPEFFDLTTGLLSFTFKVRSKRVVLETPFQDRSKADIVQWALLNGLTETALKTTSSCYHPVHQHCGVCGTCFKRWIAFTLNEISEDYDTPPWESEYAKRSTAAMVRAANERDFGHYSRGRIAETFAALRTVRELTPDEWRAYSIAVEEK